MLTPKVNGPEGKDEKNLIREYLSCSGSRYALFVCIPGFIIHAGSGTNPRLSDFFQEELNYEKNVIRHDGCRNRGISPAGCSSSTTETTAAASSAEETTTAAEETTTEAASESAAENTGNEAVVRVGGLKGPTTMGLVKLMDEAANGESENSYEFTMVTAADEMTAMVAGGKVDIALLPANVASVLYNKTNKNISVIDINTLGVLYFVSADSSVATIDQLKGKTVYLPGKELLRNTHSAMCSPPQDSERMM